VSETRSVNQGQSPEQQGATTKKDLAHLLNNRNLNHPALNRISVRLGTSMESGVESRITSYDRMHHRHNRALLPDPK
jgi:hypothetical protein